MGLAKIGRAKIVRRLFENVMGTVNVTQSWERCSRNSAVCVNATEFGHFDLGSHNQTMDENKLTGAIVFVTNVGGFGMGGKFGSGIKFVLHVESESPINVMVTMAYLGEWDFNRDPAVIPVDERDISGDTIIKP